MNGLGIYLDCQRVNDYLYLTAIFVLNFWGGSNTFLALYLC